jgi:hypothetical protein
VLTIGVPKIDSRLSCSDCVHFRQESIGFDFGQGSQVGVLTLNVLFTSLSRVDRG